MSIPASATLAIAIALAAAATAAPNPSSTHKGGQIRAAWSLDVTGADYDEECMIYCLQGIVNRRAPRLFLDTSAIFWQYQPSDAYWMRYLSEHKGFRFTPIPTVRGAVERFRPDLKGLVVYDPGRDASRYVALTMCAQRDLLPVTPDMLAYRTPVLSGGAGWTADDMSAPSRWRPYGVSATRTDDGMKVTVGQSENPYGPIDRLARVDLRRAPILEVTVASCTGKWAVKVNEDLPVDTVILPEQSGTGTFRADLRELLKRPKSRVMVRMFAVGAGASVVYRQVRFLTAEGQPVAPDSAVAPDCFRGLPVVEDLRGRFADDLSAYRWALDHLMPACTKRLAFSAGHTHGDTWLGGDPAITIGLDYPIAQKAFIFNLSPIGGPWQHDGKPHPGYAAEAKLFDEVMASLQRPAAVFGWSEPEDVYCGRISKDGNYILCAGAPNLSFWARVPTASSPILLRPLRKDSPFPRGEGGRGVRFPRGEGGRGVRNKYYVTFQTNEGDTPKIVAGLMGGAWLSPQRGSVPIAWGIDPLLADLFPALIEYYARTAGPGDSFFAGCSGAGYCYPWHMPNMPDYARQVGSAIARHGPEVVDVWENGLQLDRFARFNALVHAGCLTQQTNGAASNSWLLDGTPVLSADRRLYYYDPKGPDPAGQVIRWIADVAAAHNPPFFILCYGGVAPGLPGMVADIRKRLPADRFEIVGAGDMTELAREAGELTIALDAAGVSPGGAFHADILVRNPTNRRTAPGRIRLNLPARWKATENDWSYPALAPGATTSRRMTIATPTTSPPFSRSPDRGDRGRIICTDSRTGARRSASIDLYAATIPILSAASHEGWIETGATLSFAGGKLAATSPGSYASVRKSVDLDFDREPVLEIAVASSQQAWALKVNDGTLPSDDLIQSDTGQTGRFTYDLRAATGWSGKKRMDLILFEIGPGKTVEVSSIDVHYRR
jgi:hypothetical protein